MREFNLKMIADGRQIDFYSLDAILNFSDSAIAVIAQIRGWIANAPWFFLVNLCRLKTLIFLSLARKKIFIFLIKLLGDLTKMIEKTPLTICEKPDKLADKNS